MGSATDKTSRIRFGGNRRPAMRHHGIDLGTARPLGDICERDR